MASEINKPPARIWVAPLEEDTIVEDWSEGQWSLEFVTWGSVEYVRAEIADQRTELPDELLDALKECVEGLEGLADHYDWMDERMHKMSNRFNAVMGIPPEEHTKRVNTQPLREYMPRFRKLIEKAERTFR